ncbi:MAG: hypothetical protein CM15mP88_0230 [Pseudomonadota bacterium]|nr:MAG: hypothetical protein CM15mP88_0230 [Pseudomonadota bacterium]
MGAMGLENTGNPKPWHLMRRTEAYEIRNYSEIFDFLNPGGFPNEPLPGELWGRSSLQGERALMILSIIVNF